MVNPGIGYQEGRRDERKAGFRPQSLGQAAPGPVLGPADEAGAKWVAFDVPTYTHQVRHLFDRLGSEPSLVDGPLPDGSPPTVPACGVGSSYPLHEAGEGFGARWTHDEVPVVGEDAVGDEPHRVQLQSFVKDGQKGPIIGWTLKNRDLADAAVYHVEEARSERRSCSSWHWGLRRLARLVPRPAPRVTVRALSPSWLDLWERAPSPLCPTTWPY
jgi:hypothetical protein